MASSYADNLSFIWPKFWRYATEIYNRGDCSFVCGAHSIESLSRNSVPVTLDKAQNIFIGTISLVESSRTENCWVNRHLQSVLEFSEADPCVLTHLQVCRADGQQRSSGLGVTGGQGVLLCPAHDQHRKERHGVHVAARPQTGPRPSIELPLPPGPFGKGKGEQHLIKYFSHFIPAVWDNSGIQNPESEEPELKLVCSQRMNCKLWKSTRAAILIFMVWCFGEDCPEPRE